MSQSTPSHTASRRGLIAILAAAISWGTAGITTQALYNLTPTNPFSIAFFRLAIGSIILLCVCWGLLGHRLFKIKRRDLFIMLFMGILHATYQSSFFAAITYSGVAIASLITLCTAPVIVALLSVTITRERMTPTIAIALVCSISGTALLVMARSTSGLLNPSLPGIFLALLAACGYAGVILSGRRLTSSYHPLQINAIAFSTGALLLLCLALSTKFVITYPVQGWLMLLYLGSVPTAIAYGLFLIGMRSTSATVTSIVTLFEPLTSTILAWIFFGERLGPLGLLGASLLVGAILLLTRKQK